MPDHYRKGEELRGRINSFLWHAFGLPEEDYYARLDLKNLLALKAALSDINNTLTMRLALGFLDWVSHTLSFDAATSKEIRAEILSTKPNSNGYDIHCLGPIPFVAEVKCNIPVNGGIKYGARQRYGILEDIGALLNGKSKASSVDPHALKFMVFLDLPEVRAATEHLMTSSSISKAFRILGDNETPSDPAIVYGVYSGLAI